jgi:small subunit ribosomal protein S21
LEVTVSGRDVEKAIRDLKRKIQRDGIFRDLKNRRFYEKPSLKKKRKQREARKRKAKALRMGRSGSR